MNKKLLTISAFMCIPLIGLTGCKKKNQEHVLKLRNLYFSSWDGSDPYTDVIESKFGVEIEPSSYDYNSWGEQVMGEVNGDNLGDVFHFDLESFNFGNTYKNWAEGGVVKALPRDLSRWPKVKKIIEQTSNIDYLKIDGDIYGIPLAYNQDDPSKDFSSFTYVYRRDWLKAIDPTLVKEDDVYTWEEFNNIIEKFSLRSDVQAGNSCAIGDVAWGFPSLTNFFKDSPHCYSVQPDGHVVNAFTTPGYQTGLELTRSYCMASPTKYFDQVSNTKNTKAYDDFKGGHMGIYYENLSLSNYTTLRKDVKELKPGITEEALNDFTAIMKVKGPDGKFHLEGSENWFSMTFFNADISDSKQEKILDILDYLLGEEGTDLAIYGKKDVDYYIDENGDIELISDSWTMTDGEYVTKNNGAKYLREMITLNNDTASYDPFTDQKSYEIITKWTNDMKSAKAANQLVTFGEPPHVKWLSTGLKDQHTSSMIGEGNDFALKFAFDKNYPDISEYVAKFDTAKWNNTIAEVNRAIGK